MITLNEMKKRIVREFIDMYGFAPSMNKIVPLESGGAGNLIDWLAFGVNGVGYVYDYRHLILERAEQYDYDA